MTLIKCLRTAKLNKAQAYLEYFILFGLVALLTIISLSAFLPQARSALLGRQDAQGKLICAGFFQKAVGPAGLNAENAEATSDTGGHGHHGGHH